MEDPNSINPYTPPEIPLPDAKKRRTRWRMIPAFLFGIVGTGLILWSLLSAAVLILIIVRGRDERIPEEAKSYFLLHATAGLGQGILMLLGSILIWNRRYWTGSLLVVVSIFILKAAEWLLGPFLP